MGWEYDPTVIKRRRLYRKITIEKLAELSGLDPGNLSKIERGIRRPRADTLGKLAAALKLTPRAFYQKTPDAA
jgi:transcriptional regulator with XRE-family HTH domain